MNNARSSEEFNIRVHERGDGQLTVKVTMIGWTAQHFTSLQQNETLKSKIASKIALAVYDHYLRKGQASG